MLRALRFLGIGFLCVVAAFVWNGWVKRTPLPNGLELGKRFPFETRYDAYLWSAEGELIVPEALDLMCFSDAYVKAWTMNSSLFLYETATGQLTFRHHPDYTARYRASDLAGTGVGCGGYTEYWIGAAMFVLYPSELERCTLEDPCPLEARRP